MKFGMTKEVDWEYIGANLARGDDEEQSAFFKGLINECLSWGTTYQIQMQFAAINKKLTKEEREILSMITYIEEC